MVTLNIDNKEAVLPNDFSIEIISENPYFTRTSNYSLDIKLPLVANLHIFGMIDREDLANTKMIFPSVLSINGLSIIIGSAIICKIDSYEVTIQITSGNAEFNLLTNGDYIDDLDLGSTPYPPANSSESFLSHNEKKKYYGSIDQTESVWLTVMYDDNKVNNAIVYHTDNNSFHPRPFYNGACVQPYLLTVIRRLINHYGFVEGHNYIEENWTRNIYIVNAIATNKIAKALPHWSVSEFFDEIEKLFGVITLVSDVDKTVSFVDINTYYNNSQRIYIDKILDVKTIEISETSSAKDVTSGNVGYKLGSKADDGYLRLDSSLVESAGVNNFSTYDEMVTAWSQAGSKKRYGIYASENRYYINYAREGKDDILKEVNLYADLNRNNDSSRDVEFKISPAKISVYNIGTHFSITSYMRGEREAELYINVPYASFYSNLGKEVNICVQDIVEGDDIIEGARQKKDIMEIAISTGEHRDIEPTYKGTPIGHRLIAMPYTDYNQTVSHLNTPIKEHSLSLKNLCQNSIGARINSLRSMNSTICYKIKFIHNIFPQTNQIFVIENKKYVASKIEFKITSNGFNNLYEGTFYRID